MTVDDLMEAMESDEKDVERCRSICKKLACVLDDHEASTFDAIQSLSFMLGSAVDSLAEDAGISIEGAMQAATILIEASARLHAHNNHSTEGMTAN